MRYGKIVLPLCMAGSQAMAGQVSGGGPSAIKAEEYMLPDVEFRMLRERLRGQASSSFGQEAERAAEQIVIRDEAGQTFIVRRAPTRESED
jgi:hypothetical protein